MSRSKEGLLFRVAWCCFVHSWAWLEKEMVLLSLTYNGLGQACLPLFGDGGDGSLFCIIF